MIIFRMTRSDSPNITFVESCREYDATKNMTFGSIVNKTFQYKDNEIDLTISVSKEPTIPAIREGMVKGFNEYRWIMKSLYTFGKIISPEEQRRNREKKLMSL